eukprot:13333966-Heterocapsa_arctica.AAC.1
MYFWGDRIPEGSRGQCRWTLQKNPVQGGAPSTSPVVVAENAGCPTAPLPTGVVSTNPQGKESHIVENLRYALSKPYTPIPL